MRMLFWFFVVCLVRASSSTNHCGETDNPDVRYFDVRIPLLDVPNKPTHYVCQVFKVPDNDTYHAIAFEPLVTNRHVMHHMLLFGCDYEVQDPDMEAHVCTGSDGHCKSWLAQWTLGVDGQIFTYPDTGVKFGKNSYRYMSLQIHWNNDHGMANQTDNSGMRIYYTKKLRRHDVGNVQIGQQNLDIPPNSVHNETGGCSGTCTSGLLSHPVFFTRSYIHMHYLGLQGLLEVVRDDKVTQTISYDPAYDYKISPIHYHDPPVEILPGDEVRLTCTFDSRTGGRYRNHSVYFGEGSDAEMCYAFITYYPLVQNFDQCLQFDKYDVNCFSPGRPFMGGCVFGQFHQEAEDSLLADIIRTCDGSCGKVCVENVKHLTRHPCLQENLGKYSRRVILSGISKWPEASKYVEQCTDR